MNLKKLQQDRADAATAAKVLHDAAAAGNRLMTTEEMAAYDGHMANVESLDRNIKIAKAQLDTERTAPAVHVEVSASEASKKKFGTLGEQLMAIKEFETSGHHKRDDRLFAALGQNETIDAEGGFRVQPDFAPDLLKRVFAGDEIVKRCTTRPVSSSRLVLNGMDDANRTGGYAGMGVAVYRVAEAGLIGLSKIKYRRVELNMNKLVGAYAATDEVLDDAPALQADVQELFPAAFSWRLGNEVINGTGKGQFLGINTSGATVVVAKEVGQAAASVVIQNLIKMKQRLWVGSRKNAVWVMGPDIEAMLITMSLPGNAGSAEAIYTPAGMYGNNSGYAMLLGMSCIVVEQTAAIGLQGDVMLCDFSQYVIGNRNDEAKFASSIHVAFLTDEQVFRWTLRNDGQPYWDKPVIQNNSSNTVSPFVVLAARQ